MARIRSIKPEFWTSLPVSQCSVEARLTFIGLWNYCDDEGRGKDDSRLIRSAVWPLDDVSLDAISVWMAELEAKRLITRYVVNGYRFFFVSGWKEHQKVDHPAQSRFPAPPSLARRSRKRRERSGTLANDSRLIGAGSREQGAGSREQGAGSREQGLEQGAGSREQGAGIGLEQGSGTDSTAALDATPGEQPPNENGQGPDERFDEAWLKTLEQLDPSTRDLVEKIRTREPNYVLSGSVVAGVMATVGGAIVTETLQSLATQAGDPNASLGDVAAPNAHFRKAVADRRKESDAPPTA